MCKLYFVDEAGVYASAPNTYTWREKGDPLCVKKAPKSEKINLIGAVEVGSGAVTVEEVAGYTTHAEVLPFLERLGRGATEDCPVFVFLDRASMHTHHKVLESRAGWAERHLYVFYLPSYSPHLNDMERVWRHLKYHLLRRRHYASLDALRRDVFAQLEHFCYFSSVPDLDGLLDLPLEAA